MDNAGPRRLARRIDDWFMAEVSLSRLRRLRIVLGGFIALYLAFRMPVFLALADNPASRWEAAGVLSLFSEPWPSAAVVGLAWASLVLALLFTVGRWYRLVGPAFALVLLLLFSYRSSWGQLLHFENLMFLHVAVLAMAPAGARRVAGVAEASTGSAWPVRLMAMVTAATYVLAGLAKFRIGGASWLFGDVLRNHIASANVRLELLGESSSPVGRWAVSQAWMLPPFAIATVFIELSAPLALLGRRMRNVWVASVWLMHAGIAATMFIVFPMPFFGVAFAPLFVRVLKPESNRREGEVDRLRISTSAKQQGVALPFRPYVH